MLAAVDVTLAAGGAGGVGVSVLLMWCYRFWSRTLASREHAIAVAPTARRDAMETSVVLVERLMSRVAELERQVASLQKEVHAALDEARQARAAEQICREDTQRQQKEIDELRELMRSSDRSFD